MADFPFDNLVRDPEFLENHRQSDRKPRREKLISRGNYQGEQRSFTLAKNQPVRADVQEVDVSFAEHSGRRRRVVAEKELEAAGCSLGAAKNQHGKRKPPASQQAVRK